MIKDFDIFLKPITGGNYTDISTLSSVNLAFQQIENVIYTSEGEVPFFKEFGSPYSLFVKYSGYEIPSILPITAAAIEHDLPYVRDVNIQQLSQSDGIIDLSIKFSYAREKTLSKNLELRLSVPIDS